MKENGKQIPLINEIKGAAIILVVIGHAISGTYYLDAYSHGEFWDVAYYLVESFQMPLFFMISGFLFAYTTEKKQIVFNTFIVNKVFVLGLPYIFGTVIYTVIGMLIHDEKYTVDLLVDIWHMPVSHFWFLYIQLIIYCMIRLYKYRYKYSELLICVLYIFWIVYCNCSNLYSLENFFPLDRLLYYSCYFIAGELLHHYKKKINYEMWSFSKRKIFILLMGYTISFFLLYKYNLHQSAIGKTMIAIIGCYCFTILISRIDKLHKNCSRVSAILSYLGTNTLPIYMFHSIFISFSRKIVAQMGIGNIGLVVLLTSLFGIIGPVIWRAVGEKIPILCLPFYPQKVYQKMKGYITNERQ
ncbi:acyltransferase family protein [Robinsoniella peoriensis]